MILARYLPAFLCIGVAVTQFVLAQTAGLMPWRGGGFGMYATVDDAYRRRLYVEAVDENGQVCILPQRFFSQKELTRLLTFPHTGLLKRRAEELLNGRYAEVPNPYKKLGVRLNRTPIADRLGRLDGLTSLPAYRPLKPHESPSGNTRVMTLRAVRLTVLRPVFDPSGGTYVWTRLKPPVEAGAWS